MFHLFFSNVKLTEKSFFNTNVQIYFNGKLYNGMYAFSALKLLVG